MKCVVCKSRIVSPHIMHGAPVSNPAQQWTLSVNLSLLPFRARFTQGEWLAECFCIFLIRKGPYPDTAFRKLVWHNSKPSCAVKSGPLDSKEEKRNYYKRKMPCLQKSKSGVSRELAGQKCHQRRSLFKAISFFLLQKSSGQVTIKQGYLQKRFQ